MTTTRELTRIWNEDGITYHEAYGKRTTIWVECPECGKRQPAGIVTLTAYGDREVVMIEILSSQWARPQIGRCNVCATRGPLVEVNLIPTGSVSRTRCDRRCLEATGDNCNCGVCFGRDHGAGECSCGKETA